MKKNKKKNTKKKNPYPTSTAKVRSPQNEVPHHAFHEKDAVPATQISIGCFSEKTNMRSAYGLVSSIASQLNKKCPVLIAEQEFPTDIDYVRFEKTGRTPVFLTRKGLSDESIAHIMFETNVQKYNGIISEMTIQAESFFGTSKDMADYYGCAAMISFSLGVRCPQIVLRRTSNGMKATAYNTPGVYGKTTWIEVNDIPGPNFADELESLSHEMRHCWQHELYPERYFAEYHFYDWFPEDRKEEYYLQPAEIDACAYALRVIRSFFNCKDLNANKPYQKANEAIEQRAEELDEKLFKVFE